MPSYTYRCKKCQEELTVEQSIHDNAFTSCKEIDPKKVCEGEVLRLIGRNVGVQFVGSGFYVNDTNGNTAKSTSKKDA